ncbi:MAG: FAD:protein FMN transferase, partial [Anaerolineales bacterium]|nr:FAD:protein FMN transferase [Anaerolineales bacterium]
MVEVRMRGGLASWEVALPPDRGGEIDAPLEADCNPQVSFRAMGCAIRVELETEDRGASRRLSQVAGWFETWESRLSRFRPESELSQLNARAGEVIPVSPMMW